MYIPSITARSFEHRLCLIPVVADKSGSFQLTTRFTGMSLAPVKAKVTRTYSMGIIKFPVLSYRAGCREEHIMKPVKGVVASYNVVTPPTLNWLIYYQMQN